MWSVSSVSIDGNVVNAAMSDGLPLSQVRDMAGQSVRLNIEGAGFLDFTSIASDPSGGAIEINGYPVQYSGTASFDLYLRLILLRGAPTYAAWVSFQGGQTAAIPVTPFYTPSSEALSAVTEMETLGIVPYRNNPDGGKTKQQLTQLGLQYFPFHENPYAMALSVYDWTTADFFRMDLFNLYRYSALPGLVLSNDQIADGIWTSDWGTYKPSDADFMNSFMMTPASSEADVAAQLKNVEPTLVPLVYGLKQVTATAMASMPRTTTAAYPKLYSGQVSIENLGNDALVTYFEEYPGNAGPAGVPMGMPVSEALNGFMLPGNVVTYKSFMSFTNNQQDAEHYSNGIVITLLPPNGKSTWGEHISYITQLSDQADKIEYTITPGTQVQILNQSVTTIDGKPVQLIEMQIVN